MMNVTDYTNIKTLLIKFKEKSDVLYAKASALSNYATIEWVGTQIPSVGNGTVTIKQNGASKGSFTMNQSGGATINLTDTTYSSLSAVSGGTDKSLVTTGEKYTWNSKQAAISDLATIRSNATTAYGWGDHSKAGYLTGITKAMVESVLTGTITSHTHTFASLISKPTTLSGYGITDASRIFRYTIPASGNKGVRIAFTSHEPVKITVSGENGNAQLMLVGTGYGAGGFLRNNFTELVQSFDYYTWCLADENRSVEVFSTRAHEDVVTVESPSPVTFTAISALSKPAAYRHLLTSENYSSYALPLTGGTISGLLTITANANYGLSVNSILTNSQAAGINFQINGTTYGRVLVKNTKELLYNDMTKTYTVYHSGNSNNTDTVWSAKRLATPDNLICPYIWKQNDLNLTGTLVLSLPYGFNSMMQCIELTVYDYSTAIGYGGATKFFINGYNYAGNSWTNPYVFQIGNKNVKVRLGYYNNKCCILIGETNTKWTYPRICVDKVYGSYSSHANDFKNDDWSCAILQDESGITDIKTASDTPLYAPCYTRAGLPYVTDNDVAAKYLKLAGGTITGSIKLDGDYLSIVPFVRNFKSEATGGWSRAIAEIRVDNKNAFRIAAYGSYTPNAENNKIQYAYLGFAGYNGLNLRISDTSLSWGDNVIYHAGNCNLPTVPWTCSSLVSTNDVTAKTGLYGRYLEFSNITSSAGHGGYIDFHYNGSTADYTSRIIENAASQLTLIASTVKATGDVKATGWCKATNGFLIEESGVYFAHSNTAGEIDIVNNNILLLGSKSGSLYFNYRATGNGAKTVTNYIWHAGSETTYATHTMGALTVIGAITATTTIHATTGIYTDGYISAKQASTSSDRRLKTDFRSIDNALKYILNTHYTRFRWKDDNKESIGIIAQEEQNREYGFLVQNRKEIGHLTYDYAASTALLGAAIQEEDSKVEKLRKRIIKLENELSNLKKKWQH